MAFQGKTVIKGKTEGIALVSREPLSFWGGYDWQTGEIIDRRHPLSGQIAKGRILAIPFTRGSSTTTAVLLEAIRAGTAPAAIVAAEADFFFALASVVADELYAASLPLVTLRENDFGKMESGDEVRLLDNGTVIVRKQNAKE
ncbi:MAG: hypothetical protein KPEEDBHJ_01155 [Anaerolineales bacterium]|nr:hypothetical protein [Anaerolineales bacterium]